MITHLCDVCEARLGAHFLELSVRVLRARDSADNADALEELHGEYCDACIGSGKAHRDLVTGLSKYRFKSPYATQAPAEEPAAVDNLPLAMRHALRGTDA